LYGGCGLLPRGRYGPGFIASPFSSESMTYPNTKGVPYKETKSSNSGNIE